MKPKVTAIYDFLKEIGGLERVMFFQTNILNNKYNPEMYFSYVSDKDKARITKELELGNPEKAKSLGRVDNEFIQLSKSFIMPSRVNRLKTDLIISHSFMASRMANHMKKKYGTPYIVMLYHPPNFIYSKVSGWANNIYRIAGSIWGLIGGSFLRNMDKEAVRNADLIISISEYTKKRVQGIYGKDSIIVYPQVSNFFRMMPKEQKKKFIERKNIKNKFLLAHGRIIPDKNYDILFDAVKSVGADLIISGGISEDYKKKLMNLARVRNISNKVKILGRISSDDLLGYYNCAEVFLMPAKKEDFGLTPIEAMACGTPVVAWGDGAGPSETVIPGTNGFLAVPYRLDDFENKINLALKKKWNKQRIVKSVGKFSEKEVAKSFLDAVAKVLGTKNAKSHK